MEYNQNGRLPKWKMTKMEDKENGRQAKWPTNRKEDDKKTKLEDDQNRR